MLSPGGLAAMYVKIKKGKCVERDSKAGDLL